MVAKPVIILAFLGDLMLGRGVSEEILRHPPDYFWGTTLPILKASDAVFANLECAITSHNQPWDETFKVFHFRADPKAIDVLRAGHVKAVSLANNHSLDYKAAGLLDTIKYLDKADIKHAGAGKNLKNAREPALLQVKGLVIGFISMTDNELAFKAKKHSPGTNFVEFNRPESLEILKDQIQRARDLGANFIVLSVHWGPNWPLYPSEPIQDFAHQAIDMGVNIIHGHSPHIFQGVEFYGGGAILYGTGDFIDDYAIDHQKRNDWSLIFQVKVEGREVKAVKAVPVFLSYAQTNLASEAEAKEISARIVDLSKRFGTKAMKTNKGLVLSN